jgi:hypothetical protein
LKRQFPGRRQSLALRFGVAQQPHAASLINQKR